jgi:hypothetical protein
VENEISDPVPDFSVWFSDFPVLFSLKTLYFYWIFASKQANAQKHNKFFLHSLFNYDQPQLILQKNIRTPCIYLYKCRKVKKILEYVSFSCFIPSSSCCSKGAHGFVG